MNSTTLFGLAVDSRDAGALATFWSAVLDRPVSAGATAENAAIEATDGAKGPRLAFHQVPESKTVKNRLHLDLISPDFEGETRRLIGLGAKPADTITAGDAKWTTFTDIEGNEFDLIAG